jgi:bifunctional polynucleotide phosphatase/kinase
MLLFFSLQLQAQRRTLIDRGFGVSLNGKVKVAFFDADSTLRVSLSGSVSANHINDVQILPCVSQRLAQLTRKGYLIALASNQGGVAAGFISYQTADGALRTTINKIKAENPAVRIHSYDFADQRDIFRKPNIGMAQALENNLAKLGLSIDKSNSLMVGDSLYKTYGHFSNSDRLFAENYGLSRVYDPADFFGWYALFDWAHEIFPDGGPFVFRYTDQVSRYKNILVRKGYSPDQCFLNPIN